MILPPLYTLSLSLPPSSPSTHILSQFCQRCGRTFSRQPSPAGYLVSSSCPRYDSWHPVAFWKNSFFFFFLRCFSLIDHFFFYYWGLGVLCFVSRGFYSICCWAGVYGRDSFEMGLLSLFFFSHLRQECRWAVLLILLLPPGRNLSFHSWSK